MGTPLGQLLGRAGAWLVDLTIGGRVVRVTTAPGQISITAATGTAVYVPGLAPLSIPRTAGRLRSVALELTVTPPDFAELQARGQRLDFGSAIVRRWYGGQTLEQATVAISGRIGDVEYGDPMEPLSCTVFPDANDAGLVPSPSMRVDPATWPVRSSPYTTDQNIAGVAYPIVIGQPGGVTVPGVTDTPASPALLVETATPAVEYWSSRWLIAGHKVNAATVTLYDISGNTSGTATVVTSADALGLPVSYVQADSVSGYAVHAIAGHEYGVSWPTAGGALDDDGSALRGANKVISWLLRKWTRPGFRFDVGRQAAQSGALDAYLLDFAITSPTDPVAWIRQHLLPILPIEEVEGPDGLYFRAIRVAPRAADVVGHIDCSPDGPVTRASRLASRSTAVANRITLDYAMGGPQRRHLRRIIADGTQAAPADPALTDDRAVPLWLAEWSQTLFGVRDLEVSTAVITDDSTAGAVLAWLLRRYAVPRRTLQVVGDVTLDRYSVGDVVTVTASDLYLTSVLAIVREVEALDTAASLVLELDDDPTTIIRKVT